LICPHCRHETLGRVCEDCGWERTTALLDEARRAETERNWKKGYRLWTELVELLPGDLKGLQGQARCWAQESLGPGRAEPADFGAALLTEALSREPGWEEGFDLLLRVHEREGTLPRLAEWFERECPSQTKRLRIIRLVLDFKSPSGTARVEVPKPKLWPRILTLLGGLGLVWIGTELAPQGLTGDSLWRLFLPTALIVFGVFFSVGSAIVVWRTPRTPSPDSPKGKET